MLRIVLLLALLAPALAHAQPSGPPPQSLWSRVGSWTAPQTYLVPQASLPAVAFGTPTAPLTAADPTGEIFMSRFFGRARLTTGNGAQDILLQNNEFFIDPGTFNWGTSYHTSAGYFHIYGNGSVPFSGCTTNVNCPGSIFGGSAIVVMADNEGQGPMASAWSIEIHTPATPPSGGTLDNWYGVHIEPCYPGLSAAACTSIWTENHMYNGFGTQTPQGVVHARGINETGTASATITGTTLTLLSVPTANITPGCVVSGSGVTGGTLVQSAAAAPTGSTGGHLVYTITPSQTVSSPTTMTFACTEKPLVVQNISGNTTLGFITASGGLGINEYITGSYIGSAGFGFMLAFGTDADGGATILNIAWNGAAARVAIGYGDTPGNYTLDANGDINSTGVFRVSGTQIGTANLGDIGTFSLNTTGTITSTNSTAATSTTTGAVKLSGGMSIGGDTWSASKFINGNTNSGIDYWLACTSLTSCTGNTIGRLSRPSASNDIELAGYQNIVLTPGLSLSGLVKINSSASFVAASNCGSLASSTGCLAIKDNNGNTVYLPVYGTL